MRLKQLIVLPNDGIINKSELKPFADDKLNDVLLFYRYKLVYEEIENIADNLHVLLLKQCFQKLFSLWLVYSRWCGKWLKK